VTTTANVPLLTAGTMPIALLCAFNAVVTESNVHFLHIAPVDNEEVVTIGMPPMYMEKRGAVTYIKPLQNMADKEPYSFTQEDWFADAIKPSCRRKKNKKKAS
jgi:hypothetical protein